jgi:hypothetical protein
MTNVFIIVYLTWTFDNYIVSRLNSFVVDYINKKMMICHKILLASVKTLITLLHEFSSVDKVLEGVIRILTILFIYFKDRIFNH